MMTRNKFFFFSSRRRHTRYWRDWSSDVCSSDLQYKIDIEKKFSDLRVIKSIEVNCITKNSLICYEQNLINQDEVLKIFEEIISYYSLVAYKEERKESSLAMNYNRELEEVSVGEIVKRVGVTLGVIGR